MISSIKTEMRDKGWHADKSCQLVISGNKKREVSEPCITNCYSNEAR